MERAAGVFADTEVKSPHTKECIFNVRPTEGQTERPNLFEDSFRENCSKLCPPLNKTRRIADQHPFVWLCPKLAILKPPGAPASAPIPSPEYEVLT